MLIRQMSNNMRFVSRHEASRALSLAVSLRFVHRNIAGNIVIQILVFDIALLPHVKSRYGRSCVQLVNTAASSTSLHLTTPHMTFARSPLQHPHREYSRRHLMRRYIHSFNSHLRAHTVTQCASVPTLTQPQRFSRTPSLRASLRSRTSQHLNQRTAHGRY